MLSILDLHGINYIKNNPVDYVYYVNVFLGDVIFGNTAKDNVSYLDKRMDYRIAKNYYKNYLDQSNYTDSFYDTPHYEANLFANRFRRYTTMGLISIYSYFELICPFIDNDIIDFIFSIPDEYRFNNKLYEDMLLKYYPALYVNIPWQRTLSPIKGYQIKNLDIESVLDNNQNLTEEEKQVILNNANIYKNNLFQKDFFDYNSMMHEEKIQIQIDNILKEGILKKKGLCKDDLSDCSIYKIGALVSAESYLQQISSKYNVDYMN